MSSEKFEQLLKGLTDYLLRQEEAIAEFRRCIANIIGAAEPEHKPADRLERVKALFGEHAGILDFRLEGDVWRVTPRQFLGAENFAKIAKIVRDNGGDYVSAGKDSHFRLPAK